MKKKTLLWIILGVVAAGGVTAGVLLSKNNTPVDQPTTPVETVAPTEKPTDEVPQTDLEALNAAKNYLKNMYKDKAEATPSDYDVVSQLMINGQTYTIEWSVEITDGSKDAVKVVPGDTKTVIDVDEQATEDTHYVLTATIIDPVTGETVTQSFNHKVPAFKKLSYAEYVAAKDGDPVTVGGVVTGVIAKSRGNSSNCLYLQDETGGYYVYSMKEDPASELGILPGMTVSVTGTRSTYSGTYEITNASVNVLDRSITEVTPADYTDIYTNAKELTDAALVEKQSFLVTIKGVEITDQVTGSGYYKFKLGNLESYVRISSSVCPLTKEEQALMIEDHAAYKGMTADVSGVICVYNGAFYLTPVSADAFVFEPLPERDDAGMVAYEKEILSLPATISEDCVLQLRTQGRGYKQVSISWTSDSANAVVGEDGTLTVKIPEKPAVVKMTATLSSGAVSDKKEIEVMLIPANMTAEDVIKAAFALGVGESLPGTYSLSGVVTAIQTPYDAGYQNVSFVFLPDGSENSILA